MTAFAEPYIGASFDPPAPGPRPQPAENFVWLRSLAALPTIISNPIASFGENAYRDPVTYTKLFNQNVALVHDPKMLRHIFVERAGALSAEPVRQAILKPVLREGMLTAEGDTWRRARRSIAPVFAPRHVLGFAASMHQTTAAFIDKMKSGPAEMRVADQMTRLAYLVLSRTLFSGDLDEDSEAVIGDVALFLKHLANPDPVDFFQAPFWVPRLTKLRGHGALRRLRKAVHQTAELRRQKITAGEPVPEDFLTLLLNTGDREKDKLTIDEIEDNIITFIAAGHETTARALAWTLYLLSHDHDARARCETEVDAVDIHNVRPDQWTKHLPWTTACFEEAMRLFPPAGIISRRLDADVSFGNWQISAGSNILVSPWVLHRHHLLWDKPTTFNPKNFFGERRQAIDRFAYLPFGLGQRVCIGASFATQEALIILTLLLREFRFDYSSQRKPWPVMKITVQPDNGIPMRISPRQ